MSGESQLVLMIATMHLIGLACVAILLIPALRDAPVPPSNPEDGSDDGWGHGPPPPPERPEAPHGGIPLPDAVPARVRLRDHDRLGDRLPARERRPAKEPQPDRRPVRTSH